MAPKPCMRDGAPNWPRGPLGLADHGPGLARVELRVLRDITSSHPHSSFFSLSLSLLTASSSPGSAYICCHRCGSLVRPASSLGRRWRLTEERSRHGVSSLSPRRQRVSLHSLELCLCVCECPQVRCLGLGLVQLRIKARLAVATVEGSGHDISDSVANLRRVPPWRLAGLVLLPSAGKAGVERPVV